MFNLQNGHIKEVTILGSDMNARVLVSVHFVTHGESNITGYYYTAREAINAAAALTQQTRVPHVARVENTIR